MAEQQRKLIAEMSNMRLDDRIKLSTFTPDVIECIRNHIAMEYRHWYQYKAYAHDASSTNVALHGFSMFFTRAAIECLHDGAYLEKYLVQRGANVTPAEIPPPRHRWPDEPVDPLTPLVVMLDLEMEILNDCHQVCGVAEKNGDYSTAGMIGARFLTKESKHVKDVGDLLKQVTRVSKVPGHGLYTVDMELRKSMGRMPWSRANRPEVVDRFMGEYSKDKLMDNVDGGMDLDELKFK